MAKLSAFSHPKFIYTSELVAVYCLLLFIFPLCSLSHEVPALYIFGDSTVDAGNNNHLNISIPAKADHLPFGIDFNNTHKGRYTNGKTIVDFLALKLGLPLVPAYLDLSEDQRKHTKTGINYGSGGSGILPYSNYMEKCLTLDMQIDLFEKTVSNDLPNIIQNSQELNSYLSNSLFVISIGTNDFAVNYFDLKNPNSECFSKGMDGREFANFLLGELSLRLKRLVGLGAKKFLVNNLVPLGDSPFFTYDSGISNIEVNKIVQLYAEGLPMALYQLQGEQNGPTFSYSDNFKLFQEEEAKGVLDTRHRCSRSTRVCPNRDKFFFFDGVHTTEVANSKFVEGCFDKSLCTPNIAQLIKGRESSVHLT